MSQTGEQPVLGWVKIRKFAALTGYSVNAIHCKRRRGDWEEDVLWRKAPDGNILVHYENFQRWVSGR